MPRAESRSPIRFTCLISRPRFTSNSASIRTKCFMRRVLVPSPSSKTEMSSRNCSHNSMKALLVGCSLAALALSVHATSPRFNSTTPAGGQRGTEMELRLNGARLDKSPEIVFTGSGIKVVRIDSAKTNSIKATIRIAPDCELGEHQLRVRTAGGVSELRTFWVGAYTNINEFEPNNERTKAHQIPLGVTVNGSAGGEDTDFYRVTAKKGQVVSAEVEAIRLGRTMLDSFLAIRDSEGNVLASADDTTLLMQDSFVSVVAPKDGPY